MEQNHCTNENQEPHTRRNIVKGRGTPATTDLARLDGIIRAGVAHFYFVTIHPFEDGIGRMARAITDMAMAQDEQLQSRDYSLAARIVKERKKYNDVLEKEQKNDLDITRWLD